jgi:hypothetical protein
MTNQKYFSTMASWLTYTGKKNTTKLGGGFNWTVKQYKHFIAMHLFSFKAKNESVTLPSI